MPKKKRERLRTRAKNKRERIEKKNKPLTDNTDRILTSSKPKKPSKSPLQTARSLSGGTYKLARDFTKFAFKDSALKDELKPLWDALRRLGIPPKRFFQLMDLDEFLKPQSGYKPGGRINEIFILNNKPFIDFLIAQFSEKAFRAMIDLLAEKYKHKQAIDADWKILNSQNKNLSNSDIREFKKFPSGLCDDFKTGASPKTEPRILYLDGALAKFDPQSQKLLIEVVLQLKSPSNVGDLRAQLAETVQRLRKSAFVSFQKDGKAYKVPSENVYVLAGESLGIFYGDIKRSFDPINITSEAGDILKSADIRHSFTSSSDPDLFFRIKVQYSNAKVTPNTIEKVLEKVKADFLRKRKQRKQ